MRTCTRYSSSHLGMACKACVLNSLLVKDQPNSKASLTINLPWGSTCNCTEIAHSVGLHGPVSEHQVPRNTLMNSKPFSAMPLALQRHTHQWMAERNAECFNGIQLEHCA